ncbi:MbcA/ParS/Xre antitoxin family protein [Mesorhizobium sp. P5_C1]
MQLQPIVTTPAAVGSAISDEEAGALARTTVNLFKAWNLTDLEACILLGGMSARTWARWKTGARWKEGGIGRIDRDLRTRMAHLMGIHKGLRYLFTEPARGYAWIRKPNATFGGKSALDLMLRGEISDLAAMREWLDAERGAW